jgi:hypothetical protein
VRERRIMINQAPPYETKEPLSALVARARVAVCYPPEGKLAENFLLQRTLGDGIDLAGLVAFHASPVWVLAVLADISGAGLMDEIAASLKDEGLLDGNANFESVDQILDGLEREEAAGQRRTMFEVSSLMALSIVRTVPRT